MEKATFNAKGNTTNSERFSENLNLSNITAVNAEKHGIPCTVALTFSNGLIVEIIDGYNIGYGGTGPTALYRLLIKSGFSEDDANKVFEKDITSISLTK